VLVIIDYDEFAVCSKNNSDKLTKIVVGKNAQQKVTAGDQKNFYVYFRVCFFVLF